MALELSLFLTQLNSIIADTGYTEITQKDRYRFVMQGVEQYSVDFPDHEVDDVTGDAGKYYPIATALTDWVEGFSRVEQIEYPAVTIASDSTPQYLDAADWNDAFWVSDVRYLWMPNHTPAATETMRITYTVPYKWVAGTTTTSVTQAAHGFAANDYIYLVSTVWTLAVDVRDATHIVATVPTSGTFTCKALATTIPTSAFFAVCNLIACICCRVLAARYAYLGDSTIGIDSASNQTKSENMAHRADDLCKQYRLAMGLETAGGEASLVPAGEFVNFIDTNPDWPSGRRYIFR